MENEKQIICYSYGNIFFFLLHFKLKGLIDLLSPGKRTLHIIVAKSESLKALRQLSVTPPTATYAQSTFNDTVMRQQFSFPEN